MEIRRIPEINGPETVFCYIKNFLSEEEEENINKFLQSIPKFTNNSSGDTRLQKWYQKDGKYFCSKWTKRYDKWMSQEYDEKLIKLQNLITDKLKKYNLDKYNITIPDINSCLINKYRNGNDYIKPHHDTHLTFGIYPTIINFSLGATRELLFKRNDNSTVIQSYDLESRSLFIMSGSSQKRFTHEITKSDTRDIRYSFTFREVI